MRESDRSEPHLERIKKHTKRTGAFLSKVASCVFFYEAPPSALCAPGGPSALERDVFGHLQRLQFYTGRLTTPSVNPYAYGSGSNSVCFSRFLFFFFSSFR